MENIKITAGKGRVPDEAVEPGSRTLWGKEGKRRWMVWPKPSFGQNHTVPELAQWPDSGPCPGNSATKLSSSATTPNVLGIFWKALVYFPHHGVSCSLFKLSITSVIMRLERVEVCSALRKLQVRTE